LQDVKTPVVLVEAEKSKLSVMAAGQNCDRPVFSIGLGGCWGWSGKIGIAPSSDGTRVDVKGPISDFDHVAWADRDVFICLDANVAVNPRVQAAERGLLCELRQRGARVHLLRLPQESGINGPDDYIGVHGYDAFFSLFDDTVWPEPLPLLASMESAEYPLDALPDIVRGAVEEVVSFTKAPIPLVTASALSVLSTAAQSYADVSRADRLNGPASLFMLTIADSGERKSTCDAFFSSAIRDYEGKQAELAKAEQQCYAAEFAAWTAEREGVLAAIKQNAKTDKAVESLRDSLGLLEQKEPKRPRVPKLMRGDDTPENLAWTLSHDWPSAGIITAEAGIVLGAHAMGKDCMMRNLGLLNILWDGGVLPIGRRTSASFTVRGARLTIGLQVQEATLRSFFDRSNGLARGTGFLARFLISWPKSTQGYRPFSRPPEAWPLLTKFNDRIAEILEQPAPIDEEGALRPTMLSLSPDATAAWIAFHDEIEVDLRSGGELFDVRDVASKTADNAARIAALFHTFEHGPNGPICLKCFEGASRTAAWHLNETRRFFGELALPPELANASKLNTWLIDYCQRERTSIVSRREVQRCGPNSLRDGAALDEALRELMNAGRVRLVEQGNKTEIHVNPALVSIGSPS
jgi:putative DNA primase/helicase